MRGFGALKQFHYKGAHATFEIKGRRRAVATVSKPLSTGRKAVQEARQEDREFRAYVQEAAGSQTPADQLAKLADLRDRGVITAAEFEREKAKILTA